MNTIRSHQSLRLAFITAALAVIAVAINLFFAPHGVAAGGATGMAIIIQEMAVVPVFISTLGINLVMLLLASFLLPRATTLRILYGSLVLPLIMALIPETKIVADRTLAVMVGSVVIAVGFTMLYAVDASSGGTTVPPLIFLRFWNIKTATSLFVVDFGVCLLNIPVSGMEAFILSVFSIGITKLSMSYMQTGLDRKRMLHVISRSDLPQIHGRLREVFGGSVDLVLISGTEGNWGHDVLLVVLEQSEYKNVVRVVHGMDPQALIIAGEVAEVHGSN
ncbi:YitT family protein [Lacticaseibacillus hulanensis]|uniref:YitT family protein n=1 Tax=Lacticaseibacillus hulanensis TaxID=2493111 RepID=UPI000FDCDAEB|nr:YitT family protein [Lacticaseibacillus hulanensis]